MSKFVSFIHSHKWAVLLTVIAAIIVLLLLTIGFWKTLLLVTLIGAAFCVGYIADKYGFSWFKDKFSKLFK